MKNADMPAMPNDLHPSDAGMLPQFSGGVNARDLTQWHCGLTKREYFAGLAMNRILAKDERGVMSPEITAQASVRMADALLAALDKGPES